MPRPYLVGWYYAFKYLWKIRKKHLKWRRWKQLLSKSYFWKTPKEREESMKKGLEELKKIPLEIRQSMFKYEEENE